MFKNESAWDDVLLNLEEKFASNKSDILLAENNIIKVITKLNSIADKLDNLNFKKEAEAVTNLVEVLANAENPAQEALEEGYLDTLLGDEENYESILNKLETPEEIDLVVDEKDL
jgi:hypothetical protein